MYTFGSSINSFSHCSALLIDTVSEYGSYPSLPLDEGGVFMLSPSKYTYSFSDGFRS